MGNLCKLAHCIGTTDTMWRKMAARAIFLLGIQLFLFKEASSQCIGPHLGQEIFTNLPLVDGYRSCPSAGRVVGANILIDTSTPNEISGVSIYSDDLLIDGAVHVAGNLPFVGTVAVEGVVPATGTSLVSYECGNGDLGMIESLPPASLAVLPPGGHEWLGLGVPPCKRF